jgi:hypothetical protein
MSDYAYDVVDAIYNDNKIDALDAVADAMKMKATEAIQAKRVEIAQSWFSGFTEEEEE